MPIDFALDKSRIYEIRMNLSRTGVIEGLHRFSKRRNLTWDLPLDDGSTDEFLSHHQSSVSSGRC